MTKEEAAAALDGSEYGQEGSKALFTEMKAAGLVAVFGASDDLMEFRGAIDDEYGCYNGGTAHLTGNGLYEPSCDDDRCPHEVTVKANCRKIKAEWDSGEGYSWTYETDIPHATFDVLEDGEKYARGIVFELEDAA